MRVTPEIVQWDEQSFGNESKQIGSYPYDASTEKNGRNHRLTYCYYSN
jgi:hypothetical protein